MRGFYHYCILLFRRIFGGVKKTDTEDTTWDVSSDTMRIGSDVTIGSSGSSRDSEISFL